MATSRENKPRGLVSFAVQLDMNKISYELREQGPVNVTGTGLCERIVARLELRARLIQIVMGERRVRFDASNRPCLVSSSKSSTERGRFHHKMRRE